MFKKILHTCLWGAALSGFQLEAKIISYSSSLLQSLVENAPVEDRQQLWHIAAVCSYVLCAAMWHIAARTLDVVLKEPFSPQSRASHWQQHHSQESLKLEQVKIFCSSGGLKLSLAQMNITFTFFAAWGWSTFVWHRQSVIAQIKEQFLWIECRSGQSRARVCDLVAIMAPW